MSDDLISRQDAIDAIGERPMVWTNDDQYAIGERNQYDSDKLAIETVPSAQPEIIRCKDCKKNPHWEWVGCPMTGKDTRKPDDFCSYAERREEHD